MINRNFAKTTDKQIVYGTIPLRAGDRIIMQPKAADYAAAGFKPVVDVPPAEPAPEGYHWVADGLKEEPDRFIAMYRAEINPPPAPRKFSKLKLYGNLVKAGLWDGLVAWLQSQSVEGINAYTAFTLAQDISDNHPLFKEYYQAARLALGISEEQAEAILSESLED